MKIVNICLTSPYNENWGYQDNLLGKYQSKLNNDVVTITTQFLSETKSIVKCNKKESIEGKVRIIRLEGLFSDTITKTLRIYKNLYKTLEAEKPDFIFIHGLQFLSVLTICKYLKKNKHVTCVVDNHADFTNSARSFPAKAMHKILWKYCAIKINKYARKFYGVIPTRSDFLYDMYNIPRNKIDLLVMGGDDEYIRSAKNNYKTTRRDYNINENELLIVTGGKIDKFKTDTIKLMEEVNRLNNNKVKLIVFGSVDKEIESKFNAYLSNNINYIGWINQKEIYDLLCASDLVFFPGRHSVLWEQAVACGVPAVFKDIMNTKHVDIGGNCLFMKDASEIKDILHYVLQKDNYKKMYIAANSDKKDQFLYSNIAKKSLEFAYKDK